MEVLKLQKKKLRDNIKIDANVPNLPHLHQSAQHYVDDSNWTPFIKRQYIQIFLMS